MAVCQCSRDLRRSRNQQGSFVVDQDGGAIPRSAQPRLLTGREGCDGGFDCVEWRCDGTGSLDIILEDGQIFVGSHIGPRSLCGRWFLGQSGEFDFDSPESHRPLPRPAREEGVEGVGFLRTKRCHAIKTTNKRLAGRREQESRGGPMAMRSEVVLRLTAGNGTAATACDSGGEHGPADDFSIQLGDWGFDARVIIFTARPSSIITRLGSLEDLANRRWENWSSWYEHRASTASAWKPRHGHHADPCMTTQAHRIITQVVFTGARVFGRAFAEAWKQASASQKYAAFTGRIRHGTKHTLGIRAHARRGLSDPQRLAAARRPSEPDQDARAVQTTIRHERSEEGRQFLPAEQGAPGTRAD
nr:mitochondrial import inner membrane translocase subunit tim16 [Quercus suber]